MLVRGAGAAQQWPARELHGGLRDAGSGREVGDAESGLAEREVWVEEGVPGEDCEWPGGVRSCDDGEGGWSGAGVAVGVGGEGDGN